MKRMILLVVLIGCIGVAHATVPNVPFTVSYTCAGGFGPFPFTFPISDATALTVTLNGTLLPSTGYTVVPTNNVFGNGGSVTLGASYPCTAPQILVLTRVTPVTQTIQYYDNMPIPFTTFGRSLDKLTEIAQEITGAAGSSKVSSLQMQNNGTNFLLPATGPVVLNFSNCTVSGSQGTYAISCNTSLPAGNGVVRVNSGVGAAAELSGDCTTSGSNAVTCLKTNGVNFGALATIASFQGNGTKAQLSTGSTTTNDCVKFDANGNTVDTGAPCSAGSGPSTVCTPGSFTTLTDGTTVTYAIGANICGNAFLTFTTHGGSRTLNLTGMESGGSYVLNLKQDSTGGEGLTLGSGCVWKVSGGGSGAITPSTGASAIDVLTWVYDGTNCYAVFNKNFS